MKNRPIGRRAGLVSAAGILAGVTVLTACGTSDAASQESPAAESTVSGTDEADDRNEQEPTQEEIAALFDGWNDALGTGDPQRVAERYAPNAVLLPTASAQIRTTHDEIVDYFEHFLANNPVGEKTETVVTVLDEDTAVDAGTYVFTLTDPETGEERQIDARYTYVYEKIDGEWLIVNHHSSATPAEG